MAQIRLKEKYDWPAAWLLFLAGATHEEVSEQINIPMRYVVQRSATHHWAARRSTALKFANRAIKEDLTRRVEKARISHTQRMIDQLEHTSAHIEQLAIGNDKDAGEVNVGEKLNLLDKQDVVMRRVLGMDKEEKADPLSQGFALLAAMRMGNHMPSAPYPLPDDSDANTGILRPFNALPNGQATLENTPIMDVEAESTEQPGQPEPKALPEHILIKPESLVNESPEHEPRTSEEPSKGTENQGPEDLPPVDP